MSPYLFLRVRWRDLVLTKIAIESNLVPTWIVDLDMDVDMDA